MCGIIGAANYEENKETVNEWILNQYEDQHQRGSQGFGIIFIDEKGKYEVKRACEPTKAILDLYMNKSRFIIMHHRMPTSSENKISQTHPILVDNGSLAYKYLIIHNGVVLNDTETKERHQQELGFNYTTERTTNRGIEEYNDSECIAIELARFIEKQSTMIETTGSHALIAIQINKKTDTVEKIFFTRKTNPIKMSKTKNKLRLSSEGEGDLIKENTLYECSINDFKLMKRDCKFKETYNQFKNNNIDINEEEEKSWTEASMIDLPLIFQQDESIQKQLEEACESMSDRLLALQETVIEDAADNITTEEGWLMYTNYEDDYKTILADFISDIGEIQEKITKDKNFKRKFLPEENTKCIKAQPINTHAIKRY